MKKTGDSYFDSEEFRALLSDYEESVISGHPVLMDADELSEIADYYQMTGHCDEAEAAIALALSLSPGAIGPLTYRIHESLSNGAIDEAWYWLDQVIEKGHPDYVYCRAEILLSEDRLEACDKYLRSELRKVSVEEYQDYVLDVATIYADYNYPEKAMEWMSRAKQEETREFKELMGRTLFALGKYAESQRIFTQLLDTDPFSKRYWNALSEAQYMAEDYQGSIQSSEYAIAIDPLDPDGLISKANGLFKLGNYEESLEYFRRYAAQVPDDEFGYMNEGTCLINMGRTVEAIAVLHKAIDVACGRGDYLPDIYQELSFAYSVSGRSEEALQCLEMTDSMDCDHVQVEVVKGHILLSAGRMAEASFYFRDAIAQSVHPYKTLLRVIVSLYDNGYVESAYGMFVNYFASVPSDNVEGYAYMALCCYELHRDKEFLLYLKKACSVNADESKLVLGHLFPEDLSPEDYYTYIADNIKG